MLSRVVPAIPAAIPPLRNEVTALAADAGASPEQLESIRLGVSEVVTNVVVHAYPDGKGTIHLTAIVGDAELMLVVADEGCGLNAPSRHPGLGWGLALAARAGRQFTITERSDGGTEAQIRFPIGDAGPAGGRPYPRGSSFSAMSAASSRFSTAT